MTTPATTQVDDRETALDTIVCDVVAHLHKAGFLSEGGTFSQQFHALRATVHDGFRVDQTAITTVMSRLLFAISAVRRPRTILGLGTYMGNALVWLAGPAIEAGGRVFDARWIRGCDIDAEATAVARANFDTIAGGAAVELLTADARTVLTALREPVELLYLDIDSAESGKHLYADLVAAARPVLAPGALVLAHDACLPRFETDLARYRAVVSDTSLFRATVTLPIDRCGLELTLV